MNSANLTTNQRRLNGGSIHRAAWSCAVLIAALLILQPLLCTVTCIMHGYIGHTELPAAEQHARHRHGSRATESASGAASSDTTCHSTLPEAGHISFVPAFWPGMVTALSILLVFSALLTRLVARIPAKLVGSFLLPLVPPPRPLSA